MKDPTFPVPCPVCGADDEHAAWREAHPSSGFSATYCPHPAGTGHGTGCCCAGLSKSPFDRVPALQPPAADIRYEDEDANRVARVFVRVEWASGKVREYEAEDPAEFRINDPERDLSLVPMRMSVQAPGSPVVAMNAMVPRLSLSFTANPRRNMHIRTERTADRSRPANDPAHAAVQGEIEGHQVLR